MKVGDSLYLTARNRKGNNIIHRHGVIWYVDVMQDSVQCLNNKPGALIRSQTNDRRWIFQNDDTNFVVTVRKC